MFYLYLYVPNLTLFFKCIIQQACIELNTFPHKYKAIRRCTDGSTDDEAEKCTICLSPYEIESDVR